MAKKAGMLAPSKSNTSNKLASYNETKRVIGMNKDGKATKPVGLVKAKKGGKMSKK
jgi:hypothetical protein